MEANELGQVLFRLEQAENHWRAQNQLEVAARLAAQIHWYSKNPGTVTDAAQTMHRVTVDVFAPGEAWGTGETPFRPTKKLRAKKICQ